MNMGLKRGGGVRSFLATHERFLTTLLWMAQLTQGEKENRKCYDVRYIVRRTDVSCRAVFGNSSLSQPPFLLAAWQTPCVKGGFCRTDCGNSRLASPVPYSPTRGAAINPILHEPLPAHTSLQPTHSLPNNPRKQFHLDSALNIYLSSCGRSVLCVLGFGCDDCTAVQASISLTFTGLAICCVVENHCSGPLAGLLYLSHKSISSSNWLILKPSLGPSASNWFQVAGVRSMGCSVAAFVGVHDSGRTIKTISAPFTGIDKLPSEHPPKLYIVTAASPVPVRPSRTPAAIVTSAGFNGPFGAGACHGVGYTSTRDGKHKCSLTTT
ncbi:hypothetical protein DNTS_033579 [Danionella cerebrum]|uniref:Uncharacterized protein n=1 Tax=Danionella cerebrum TaxID=2873325 RepID=A0A553RCX4_9TELE|nr:hypothetical protein DNTS_033579 [Danionella translucida]